jgi:hypothetical protein|tara:strand:+ start:145 stop:309 length:165 start_codon:yes stop_codon:yes gene_type:complete
MSDLDDVRFTAVVVAAAATVQLRKRSSQSKIAVVKGISGLIAEVSRLCTLRCGN